MLTFFFNLFSSLVLFHFLLNKCKILLKIYYRIEVNLIGESSISSEVSLRLIQVFKRVIYLINLSNKSKYVQIWIQLRIRQQYSNRQLEHGKHLTVTKYHLTKNNMLSHKLFIYTCNIRTFTSCNNYCVIHVSIKNYSKKTFFCN